MPETDGQAIARSLADPSAFVAVFERHYDAIGRYLARRLPSALAAELASETFVRAFSGRARFDSSRADALPWLYGIAANLVRRHRRTERRMLRAYARTGVDAVGTESGEPHDLRELAAALAELRSADREALLLFAWADLDYAEIADALGIPVGTVRSRLSRARSRLRARLTAEGDPSAKEALDG